MNILLWGLQAALAFLFLAGGGYKVFKVDDVAKRERAISRGGWRALGMLEAVGGILLLVPVATALAAAVLALETLALAVLFGRKSVRLVAANPFPWAAVMGLLVAFVAYGRYALSPLA